MCQLSVQKSERELSDSAARRRSLGRVAFLVICIFKKSAPAILPRTSAGGIAERYDRSIIAATLQDRTCYLCKPQSPIGCAMKIAVCIKQVPVVSMLRFDNETRRMVREGVPNEVNPYDVLGVSLAARLKAEHDAEVVVVTMGPPQASEALAQAMAMGADYAIHLNDRAFAGSDTLATARALSIALERENCDLIICGRNSSDSETGQVGPEIAEMLGIPQVTAVSKLEVAPDGNSLSAVRLSDEGHEEIECDFPVLISVTDGVAEETYPRREDMELAKSRPIREVTAADLSDDASQFGESGSPTWVNDIFSVESGRSGVVIRDATPEDAVSQVMELLDERGVFDGEEASGQDAILRGPGAERGDCGAIWVVAELMGGAIRPVTLELLGRARQLASILGTTVEAALIGSGDDSHIRELTACGADTVHVADSPHLSLYDTEAHTAVLTDAIEAHSPYAVLLPSTTNGRDLAARVAGRLELGLTGDCVGIEIDEDGGLSQLKPAFGGNIVAPILSRTLPNMATIRAGILSACEPDYSIEPVVNRLDTSERSASRVRVVSSVSDESAEGAELERASRVVSVGMGIGGSENMGPIRDLAGALGASIGATRDVADAGWLPRQYQIGISGKSVAPELYIAVALRGPFNHTVGIQRSGTIIAINNSARSPIFRAADCGIVGDWREVVPVFTSAVSKRLSQ